LHSPGFTSLARAQTERPNVIIVISDDQGYGDLSAHQNPDLKTPQLDRLYTQSTRFNDFHVSPTCAPTRAALLTGHYANRTGVWHTIGGRSLLKEKEVTLANVMRANGYSTGIFGKWHLGDNYPYRPQDRGFEEVLVHGGGGVGQQPDYWDNDYFDDTYLHNGKAQKYEGYCTDVWFDNAIRFMDEKSKNDQAFFCYLSTNAPHGPYYVENKYVAPYQDNDNVPNAAFNGMIANLDENMGKLLDFLDNNQLAENTLLIFMTDNGTSAGLGKRNGNEIGYNAGMRGTKGSMYEGGHRVPFFMRWPEGGISKGKDIETLTAHVDVVPTLVDMLELELPQAITFDGTSLKALLLNSDTSDLEARVLITDSQRIEYPEKWRQSATMQGSWRLINGEELYNISEDPSQQHNIAEAYPDKVQELRAAYEQWWADLKPGFDDTPAIPLCPAASPITVLYMHDMHIAPDYGSVAWNQKLVREGMRSKGWWTVEVPENGKYKITLLRWPPEVDKQLTASVAERPALAGTTVDALASGKALKIKKAGISVGKQMKTLIVNVNKPATFEVQLQKGVCDLEATFQDEQGDEFAAFYVVIEKL